MAELTFTQAQALAGPVLQALWDDTDELVLLTPGYEDADAFLVPYGGRLPDGSVDDGRLDQPWLIVDKLDGSVFLLPMLDGLPRVNAMRPVGA